MAKFKDKMNRWFTLGLFTNLDPARKDMPTALFSVEEAKALYMEARDLTGYRFAITHLGGWQHFKALKKSPLVSSLLEEWEEELQVQIQSEALREIELVSKSEKGYQAAKYLAEAGWKPKAKGRTTKDAIKREARINEKAYEEFNNVVDLKR